MFVFVIHQNNNNDDDDDEYANDDDNNNTKYNNELSRLDQTGKPYQNLGVFFRYLCYCYLPSGSSTPIIFYAFLFSAEQKCIRLSPRALMQQNSNCDIVQCYLYKSLPCSESVYFAQLLLLFYLLIYCSFTWKFLLYLIASDDLIDLLNCNA